MTSIKRFAVAIVRFYSIGRRDEIPNPNITKGNAGNASARFCNKNSPRRVVCYNSSARQTSRSCVASVLSNRNNQSAKNEEPAYFLLFSLGFCFSFCGHVQDLVAHQRRSKL